MLSVITEIEIDTPAHIVWNILDDLDSYGEWNQVVPSLAGRTTLAQKLQATFSPDGKAQQIKPLIRRLVPLRELEWETYIPILLRARHGFVITPISDKKCQFINREDFSGLIPRLAWKKIKPTLELAYGNMNIALKNRAQEIYQTESSHSLHPAVDSSITPASNEFQGGVLHCQCSDNPVEVQVSAQSEYSFLSGAKTAWKPQGALFSFVSMVPTQSVKVTAGASKLERNNSTEHEHVQKTICRDCSVQMLEQIDDKSHPFNHLTGVHTELSSDKGWAPPSFAAYVSELVESGTMPYHMAAVRKRLRDLGLDYSDALPPLLMDKISASKAASA